jgi:arginine-tRNA-protein transferase
MIELYPKTVSGAVPCPYFNGRESRMEFFLAAGLTAEEAEEHMASGWRCFGLQFFRPVCECLECVPIRIPVERFTPSKSQRRVLRKNADVDVTVGALRYSGEILDIYREHSKIRFGKEPESEESFIDQFYTPSGPSAQSEFRIGGKLVGAGFLNLSDQGISSVYFVYRTDLLERSFGIFSMLAEIEYAKMQGLTFYYPGYWIKENSHMNYKGAFRPRQAYDWTTGLWSEDAAVDDRQ